MNISVIFLSALAICMSACGTLTASSPPHIDILQLKESFSSYEDRRVTVHACVFTDPRGAVVVVSCDPSLTAKQLITVMFVDGTNKEILSEYKKLFKVPGRAYKMDITGTPRLGAHGLSHQIEFESAAQISEVEACSVWAMGRPCD